MQSINVDLFKAVDAEDSYSLAVAGDAEGSWKAERGYGGTFQKTWTVELQSRAVPNLQEVDWDLVLERIVEAYDLNDPVITDFEWPLREAA